MTVVLFPESLKTARQIIMTYELRPEIEEDYRQIKDFWKIEDINPFCQEGSKSVIIYSGQYFGIFGFLEFIQLYSSFGTEVKQCMDPILWRWRLRSQ
jgi:hypothetical protein